MFAISGDDVGSIATLGKTEHAPSAGLYYATFEQEKWRGIYSHAIKDLSFTPSIVDVIEQLPYGSRQYPYEEKLQKWLGAFIQLTETQCKKAKSLAELVEAHNFYASYTFLMLLSSTGHRPADMFSFSITSIDIEDGWIIISDKITSPSTRVRLIPLTQLVIKQLKSYLIHLRNLSNRVQAAFPEQAEKISMIVKEPVHPLIPLFFWLDQSLNISAIDIPSFRNKLNWPYEGNVFRHYLKLFDILKGCAKIIAVGGFIDNLPQQIN
jgi:hypothetical protein